MHSTTLYITIIHGKKFHVLLYNRKSFWRTFQTCLTLKLYNIEKDVKCILILKINYVYCTHITDVGLITYQWILTLFIHKMKAYKISFLKIQSVYYTKKSSLLKKQ